MSASEPVAIAILAKAPIPGLAKTRLQSVLGPDGAAALQARLLERAMTTAIAADVGPVVLWATPDTTHPLFERLAASKTVTVRRQPDGGLDARMLAALASAQGPALVIGTDCPVLTTDHLRAAADYLRRGIDVVVVPVADGGYALIGARRAESGLFADIDWGTAQVMAATRRRIADLQLSFRELPELWDVDRPEDLERLRREGLASLLA